MLARRIRSFFELSMKQNLLEGCEPHTAAAWKHGAAAGQLLPGATSIRQCGGRGCSPPLWIRPSHAPDEPKQQLRVPLSCSGAALGHGRGTAGARRLLAAHVVASSSHRALRILRQHHSSLRCREELGRSRQRQRWWHDLAERSAHGWRDGLPPRQWTGGCSPVGNAALRSRAEPIARAGPVRPCHG
jgi:hypothetical protein